MEKTPSDGYDYLRDRCEIQKQWYDGKSTSNRRAFQLFQFLLFTCGALTPLILVLDVKELGGRAGISVKVAVATSLVAAISAAVLHHFKSKEKWRIYRDAHQDLEREKHLFSARLCHYSSTPDPDQLFGERVEAIIARERARFKCLVGEDDNTEGG